MNCSLTPPIISRQSESNYCQLKSTKNRRLVLSKFSFHLQFWDACLSVFRTGSPTLPTMLMFGLVGADGWELSIWSYYPFLPLPGTPSEYPWFYPERPPWLSSFCPFYFLPFTFSYWRASIICCVKFKIFCLDSKSAWWLAKYVKTIVFLATWFLERSALKYLPSSTILWSMNCGSIEPTSFFFGKGGTSAKLMFWSLMLFLSNYWNFRIDE